MFLKQWEETSRDETLLPVGLAGILGEQWALAFLQIYRGRQRPLQPDEILEHYPAHQAMVRKWRSEGHLDVIAATLESLKNHLQAQRVYNAVVADHKSKTKLELLLLDIPADLARDFRDWCEDRGFEELAGRPCQKRKARP
jgi:hypothetical protein